MACALSRFLHRRNTFYSNDMKRRTNRSKHLEANLVKNEPCDTGRAIGAQLARLTDVEVKRLIESGQWDDDKRCNSCAFRGGTFPNGCVETVSDALKAAVECDRTFNCHMEPGLCGGWVAASGAMAKVKAKVPWDYAETALPAAS